MKHNLHEKNGKYYEDCHDKILGVQREILDIDNAVLIGIRKYDELRDLLGMRLHYVQPLYRYLDKEPYAGMTFYFIDDEGNQKIVMVDYNEDQDDPTVCVGLYE